MKSLSSVGVGLSVVFACLFLALIAELYYLFWWRKRLSNNASQVESYDRTSPAKELFYTLCWRNNSAFAHSALNPQHRCPTPRPLAAQDDSGSLFKPFGEEGDEYERLRNYHYYPPRFLFTIVEETKEELESEGGKQPCKSRNVSLGDLLLTLETPYLTPLASPPFLTPPLTPAQTASSSSSSYSPPPKLRFLQEAEEKMMMMMMKNKKHDDDGESESDDDDDGDGDEEESFITITVDHRIKLVQQCNSDNSDSGYCSSNKVLPLSSLSPSTFPR